MIQFYLLYQNGASVWLVQFHYTKDLKKRKNKSSPETIKLRLILPQSGGEAAANASPAQLSAGRGERTSSSGNFEFVSYDFAGELKHLQTFEIILPNLIHKCKKRNLS